jgi:hypothetical protein
MKLLQGNPPMRSVATIGADEAFTVEEYKSESILLLQIRMKLLQDYSHSSSLVRYLHNNKTTEAGTETETEADTYTCGQSRPSSLQMRH